MFNDHPENLPPTDVAGDYDASLAIGMQVPGCSNIFVPPQDDSGECDLWFIDPDSNSWANPHYTREDSDHEVLQSGPRNLWDEIDAAHRWWKDHGKPGADRWRITVSPQGQRIRLTPSQHPPAT